MRAFVTGAGGFVGRWLRRELEKAGHELIPYAPRGAGRTDVRDVGALAEALVDARPDSVVHLAAVSSTTEAEADPISAFRVNFGGTLNLLEATRLLDKVPSILVVSSSEVYGEPTGDELPLTENSPLRPRSVYALSKTAQDSAALAYAARYGWPLAVARAFNHAGPGQRSAFVVPSLAHRVLAFRDGSSSDIPVGNLDVRRDFTDVRDIALGYRLLVEALADGRIPPGGRVFNICSGEAVSIGWIVGALCEAAGVEPRVRFDPTLVRTPDPPEIRGEARALADATGWRKRIALDQTLRDVWDHVARERASLPAHGQPVT